jgi:hypothetical protein
MGWAAVAAISATDSLENGDNENQVGTAMYRASYI